MGDDSVGGRGLDSAVCVSVYIYIYDGTGYDPGYDPWYVTGYDTSW